MTIQLRKAEAKDAPIILDLINKLALYERDPEAVATTVDDILRDGFGDRPIFECLIGEIDEKPCGFALYFFTWSTWTGRPSLYLEDLFVESSARGKGLGLALLKKLANIAIARRCGRMEWVVLDWNQPAREFYHQIGAKHLEPWLHYRLEAAPIEKLAGTRS